MAHEDTLGYMQDLASLGPARQAPVQFRRGIGYEAMARIHPVPKIIAEAGTGRSFFQRGAGGGGRKLEHMDPGIGRLLSNIHGHI